MATEFKLPDLGENIESAEVVNVMVAAGDAVEAEQAVVEVETDKAVMEVPCDTAGTVAEVKVKQGDTVTVGQTLLTLEPGGDGQAEQKEESKREEPKDEEKKQKKKKETKEETQDESAEAAPKGREEEQEEEEEEEQEKEESSAASPKGRSEEAASPPPNTGRDPVAAAPSVRQFAREIGINIADVEGSGPGGRISTDDVKRHARTFGGGAAAPGAARSAGPLPDFTKYGPVDRQPMSNLRKKAASHLSTGWAAPHVTLHDEADVTALENFRQQFKARVEKAGGKLTVTSLMVKIVAAALKKFPVINSSIDMQRQEVITKKYIHIGVAADTPRGLVVPVVIDADKKNITEVSVEISELANKARAGKLTLEEMAGGTFTITNLGGIGIKHFTPIINHPEVAILGLGRAQGRPAVANGQLVEKPMMPLSLSFDHRLVDGADGARFLRFIADAIEQPLLIAME